MPRSPFSRLKETVRASAEFRRECADAARRARAELAETTAATRKTIIESQELMAKAEAVIGRRAPLRKFRAGQMVRLTRRHAGGGVYVITKQLPDRDGEFEYRIKSTFEPHERVVSESDLARE